MNEQIPVKKLQNRFDSFAHREPGKDVEFWYARDIQNLLGYTRWESFSDTIERAKLSCQTSGFETVNHFRKVPKMIAIGKGAKREVEDYKLTRYACYLIAQNGDPKKEQIAFAQCYFAVQTRRQELIQERLELRTRLEKREQLKHSEKILSQLIYERGVDDRGFGRIRAQGDKALFGGFSTGDMKTRLNIPAKRPIADFLPAVTIAAKGLATEMTNHNIQIKSVFGEQGITCEHVQNNTSVRKMLVQRGIRPEELPPSEDIKKLERRVRSEAKKIEHHSRLPNDSKQINN